MAQIPLVVSTGFIVVFLWFTASGLLARPQLMSGLACIIGATVVALLVPWERFAPGWMILVMSVDVAGIGFLQQGIGQIIVGIAGLIIFPVIWIAYSFSGPILVLLIAGEISLTLSPFLLDGDWPTTPLGWGDTLLIQIVIAMVAVSVRTAARQLQRQAHELSTVSLAWRNSLIVAEDRKALIDTVLDYADSAIVFFDRAGKVYLINDPARRALTQAGGETDSPASGGRYVYQSNGVTEVSTSEQIIPRALRGEYVTEQLNWVGPPETRTALSMTSRRVSRESGETVGTLVIAHDVTTLVEAISARDDFLGNVSRELRSPLYSIVAELDTLVESVDPVRLGVAGRVEKIQSDVRRLIGLVTDLLGSSGDRVPVYRRLSDVADIVRQSADDIAPAIETAGLTLILAAPSALPAMVDAPRIRSVVDSLLSNAVKFTPPGGTVTLTAESSGTDAVIRVSDDGIGIDENDQANVFTRFYRARSARLGSVPGAGLGLSRVKAIVQAHGGQIEVRSVPTMGSEFVVRLPSVPPPVTPTESV